MDFNPPTGLSVLDNWVLGFGWIRWVSLLLPATSESNSDVRSASVATPKNIEMSVGWIHPLPSMPRLRRSGKTRWQGMNSTLAMNAAAATLEKLHELWEIGRVLSLSKLCEEDSSLGSTSKVINPNFLALSIQAPLLRRWWTSTLLGLESCRPSSVKLSLMPPRIYGCWTLVPRDMFSPRRRRNVRFNLPRRFEASLWLRTLRCIRVQDSRGSKEIVPPPPPPCVIQMSIWILPAREAHVQYVSPLE